MLRSVFLIASFLLVSSATMSVAQNNTQDSLINAVDSVKRMIPSASGKNKYDLVFKVAYELFDIDNHEAVKYADRAHQLSWEIGDSLQITKSGRLLGQLLRRVDLPDSSISQFNKMLPIAERNHFVEEASRILNALGLAYTLNATYDKALKCLFRSLKIHEDQNDEKMIAASFNNIGLAFYKMDNSEQAMEFYSKALEIRFPMDKVPLAHTLINISLCYNQFHDYIRSREYVLRALEVCGKDCSDEIRMTGEISLGLALLGSGQFDSAETHFNNAQVISNQRGDKRFQADVLLGWGLLKFKKYDFKAAERMFSKSERLTIDGGYRHMLIYTYNHLANLYTSTNDIEKAQQYQMKFFKLKGSIYTEELMKNVSRLLSEYRERVSKRRAATQEKLLKLQEETIVKQKLLNAFTGVIAALFVGFAFLLYRNGQYRKQVSLELDKRVHERTGELILNRDELIREQEERNVLLDTLSRKLNACLATFKGLGVIASRDNGANMDEYPEKFGKIAEQLTDVVRMVQKSKTKPGT